MTPRNKMTTVSIDSTVYKFGGIVIFFGYNNHLGFIILHATISSALNGELLHVEKRQVSFVH